MWSTNATTSVRAAAPSKRLFLRDIYCSNTGFMLHFESRMLYVGAGRSMLDKIYAFTYTTGTSFNLDKIYLTDTAQWYENTAFANPSRNPTSMITTQAGCSTGKCDDSRDLNRPTLYGALQFNDLRKCHSPKLCRAAILFRRRKCRSWQREH